MADDHTDLRAELRALEERVSALEERTGTVSSPAPDEATFWALHGLRARLADDPSTTDGAVMLVGSLTLPGGDPVEWQQAGGSDELLWSDWSDRAPVLAALGHPVRLELLRQVLAGVRTTAELAVSDGLGTTGQLHHHLRRLVSAGWLRQSGRGRYEVPPARVVPLLVTVLGAER